MPVVTPDVLHSRNALSPPPPLPSDAALFLDFDGTLVEIAARPELARVDARLARLMTALSGKLGGRLAVISGRPAADVAALFGTPTFAIAGSHGLELHHADGRHVVAERPAALDAVLEDMARLVRVRPQVMIEEKPLGVALHYRAAPEHEVWANVTARALADAHGLRLQPGKMMVEVRSGAGDKGSALDALMREPLMASARPIFIGDDDTDEPAFAAAAASGGYGILVGDSRETSATHRLPDVAATLDWLEAAAR